ncbi:hypothetical protein [Candidatus Parabeggiatoa sp. HSG14]|uniref:hypothetical protein n=1 Tax=Candidatus Parabeggiatoa sp. HSG14 TaxID=3055593 RepID=UPI0025A8C04C|nr:hypothetical protein [Thiotrichales bacterium HSG14]
MYNSKNIALVSISYIFCPVHSKILVVDSTYFSLWEGAADEFPGTGTNAGIKWHACFDILTGELHWFELTDVTHTAS